MKFLSVILQIIVSEIFLFSAILAASKENIPAAIIFIRIFFSYYFRMMEEDKNGK